ncbi:hypothetical protein GUJ93_ZPchr0006g43176 [Zizania palustris]|uniref:Uncharacterized protein n=1 Tax=Zizania palustris TaxID=103762 RepID=A0A8J5VXM7_ZIZPA|nr:hypothetical protein GUJ93_ZPchr0006g43176 [Zizania palustris]
MGAQDGGDVSGPEDEGAELPNQGNDAGDGPVRTELGAKHADGNAVGPPEQTHPSDSPPPPPPTTYDTTVTSMSEVVTRSRQKKQGREARERRYSRLPPPSPALAPPYSRRPWKT